MPSGRPGLLCHYRLILQLLADSLIEDYAQIAGMRLVKQMWNKHGESLIHTLYNHEIYALLTLLEAWTKQEWFMHAGLVCRTIHKDICSYFDKNGNAQVQTLALIVLNLRPGSPTTRELAYLPSMALGSLVVLERST